MSKLLRVVDNLAILYGKQEPFVLQAAEHMKASCKSGCIGCCYQMATITIAEGMMLARATLQRDDWLELAKAMRETALLQQEPGMSTLGHFKKKVPCAFLDEQKRECKVYDHRPAPCRYWYVVTPPENCYPESPTSDVGSINLMEQEAAVWRLSAEAFGGGGAPVSAPLPLMVLHCMSVLARETNPGKVAAITPLLVGVIDPGEWMEKVFPTIDRATSQDEIDAVGEAVQKVGFR